MAAKTAEELAEIEAKKALKQAQEEADKNKEIASIEAKPAANDETVVVSRSKLEALMDRLERVEAAASKAQLARYDAQHKEKMTKEIRARVFEGKLVVNERTTKNIVEKTPEGRWREDQEVEITFQDGTKMSLPYVYYIRNYKHLPGRVISESKNLDELDIEAKGDYIFKLALPSGEIVEIGSKFVN